MVGRKSGLGRMARMGRTREGRFRLALAFLIWSLVPHFQWTVHRHAEAHEGHRHQALSRSEAELADRLADELSRAALALDPAEFGGGASTAPESGASLPTLEDGRGQDSHVHFQSDPNVVALAGAPASAGPAVPVLPEPFPGYASPCLPILGAAPARGPPAILPA